MSLDLCKMIWEEWSFPHNLLRLWLKTHIQEENPLKRMERLYSLYLVLLSASVTLLVTFLIIDEEYRNLPHAFALGIIVMLMFGALISGGMSKRDNTGFSTALERFTTITGEKCRSLAEMNQLELKKLAQHVLFLKGFQIIQAEQGMKEHLEGSPWHEVFSRSKNTLKDEAEELFAFFRNEFGLVSDDDYKEMFTENPFGIRGGMMRHPG